MEEHVADIEPFYYFVIAFNVMHLVVASLLFVRQRDKFPVNGHKPSLTLSIGVSTMAVTTLDAIAGLSLADTCSVSTAAVWLSGMAAMNLMTAQTIRLWYEYNLAEERIQTRSAEDSSHVSSGWFARKRRFFQQSRLVAVAVGISVIELAVGTGSLLSLEDNGFADELRCAELLGFVIAMGIFCGTAFAFLLFVSLKFRHKKDGFGFKKTMRWWALSFIVLAPPFLLIQFWEAFTDLAYYVPAIRVLILFLSMQSLFSSAVTWPLYLSFFESAQNRMSSITDDIDGGDERGSGGEQVNEVMTLARAQGRTSVEDIELLEDGSQGNPNTSVNDNSSANEKAAPSAAAAVFSSKTLTLTLEEILLNPAYAPQMESFARHLIGEFNVEGLLFFFRVLNYQKFVKRSARAANLKTEKGERAETEVEINESQELSNFSSSSKSAASGSLAKDAGIATTDSDVEIAWKALLIYFEFLARDAPAQINIGHRVSTPIRRELEEAVVDFCQLPPTVSSDDVRLKRPLDSKVFDRAQESVLLLIERDPFVRWRKAIRERVDSEDSISVRVTANELE